MVVFIIVLASILFDIITGILQAVYNHTLDSEVLRKGLFHKLSEILALAFGWGIEFAIDYLEIGVEIPILTGVAAYIFIMEAVSIIENLCNINPRLLKFFAPYLKKYKNELEENNADLRN